MASLSRNPTSGIFGVQFWIGKRHFTKSLKTTDQKTADSMIRVIEETLYELDRGKIVLPEGVDIWEFGKTGGKRGQAFKALRRFTVKGLFTWYFEQQAPRGKETNTLSTEHTHEKHFCRILGANTVLSEIDGDALQSYVKKRAGEKWHGRHIAADTITKELSTLQLAWNRAVRQKVYTGDFCPTGDLQLPKSKEKPHFQTWAEIENAIAAQPNMPDAERKELWDSLFLRRSEIEQLLTFCRDKKTRSTFFYPMMVFAAHTGARQSEILRSLRVDFKFASEEVVVREKKRDKNKETLRRVPMSRLLRDVMQEHFQQNTDVRVHSSKRTARRVRAQNGGRRGEASRL